MCQLLLKKLAIVKEVVHVLGVFERITKVLQRNDATVSDFYGYWQILDMKLKQYVRKPNKTKLAEKLLAEMKNRKNDLFENPAMLAAIYLDPRYRHDIENDDDKVRAAKMIIAKLWQRLQMVKGLNQEKQVTICC